MTVAFLASAATVRCAAARDNDVSLRASGPLTRVAQAWRRLPPPVVLARRSLDQDFAVLLMRAGYGAVDELDVIAMDAFQARFFDLRSREWEKFVTVNAGMRQGVLTDARYFDFISYAQMLTVQDVMKDPRAVFEERFVDTEGAWGVRVVRRDAALLQTPEDILAAWRVKVGDRIYERVLEAVRRPVAVAASDVSGLLAGITAIYDYFRACGYCLECKVSEDMGLKTCTAEMLAPSILWGALALRGRKSIPNDYDSFAVQSFARASGATVRVGTFITENSIVRRWIVDS